MPSYITTYEFNRNESKYIQAVMTFNPEYRICSINENQFTETELLDINKGFVSLDNYDPWIIHKGHDQELINVLQTFFLTWKEKNFEGPLCSSDMLLENTERNEDTEKENYQNTTLPNDTAAQISGYIQNGTPSFKPSVEPIPDSSDSTKRLLELSMFISKGPLKYDERRKMPYHEIKLDEMPDDMKNLFLSRSITQILDNNSEKTEFIKNNETNSDILNKKRQTEWLNHNKNYDFYQLALEKNKFALQAIFQDLLDDRDNKKSFERSFRKVIMPLLI